MKEYKIAILGSYDIILGFKGLGIEVVGLTEEKAEQQVRGVFAKEDYAIVFIAEDWAEKLEKVLAEYYSQALPAIVTVPTSDDTTGVALRNLRKIVEQAVGSDILFKNE